MQIRSMRDSGASENMTSSHSPNINGSWRRSASPGPKGAASGSPGLGKQQGAYHSSPSAFQSPRQQRGGKFGTGRKRFTFSSLNRMQESTSGGAMTTERSMWNSWIQMIREKQKNGEEIAEVVIGARMTFPNATITRLDCGKMVQCLIEVMDEGGEESLCAYRNGIVQLVTYFSQKKHLEFTSTNLNQIVKFLIQDIGSEPKHCLDALQALSYILFNDGTRCASLQVELISTLVDKVIGNGNGDPGTISVAFGCVGNLLQRKAIEKEHAGKLSKCSMESVNLFVSLAKDDQGDEDIQKKVQYLKVVASALRVMLGLVLDFGAGTLQKDLTPLVGRLVDLIGFGMDTSMLEKDLRTQNQNMKPLDSESEWSDSERRSISSRLLKQLEKVRTTALELLQTLCKVEYKAMQAQWEKLLPQRNACDLQKSRIENPNLLTIILYDPQPRVRAAAVVTLKSLIEHGAIKLWLSQRRPKGASAFAPLSVKIARIVEQIHVALATSLTKEQNPTVRLHLFACSATLVHVVPYEVQGNESMLSPFLEKIGTTVVDTIQMAGGETKISEANLKISEAAVGFVSTLVSTKEALGSVEAFINHTELLGEHILQTSFRTQRLHWALAFIGKLSRLYFVQIIEKNGLWPSVRETMKDGFKARDSECRAASLIVVEEVSKSKYFDPLQLEDWDQIISGDVPRALGDIIPTVRAAAASALAGVGTNVWESMTAKQRQVCTENILHALSGGTNVDVKVAVLTALASMALLPSFKNDQTFMGAIVQPLLVSLEDETVQIRSRAAIAIANTVSPVIVDSGKENGEEETSSSFSLRDALPLDTRLGLFQGCLNHCDDQDKVAPSSLRAVGYLVPSLCEEELNRNRETQKNVQEVILHGIGEAQNPKVRWNACNALSHIMSNAQLSSIPLLSVENETVMRTLKDAATKSENFKVRIAAIGAFGASPLGTFPKETQGKIFNLIANTYESFLAKEEDMNVEQLKFSDKLIQALKDVLKKMLVIDPKLCTNQELFVQLTTTSDS